MPAQTAAAPPSSALAQQLSSISLAWASANGGGGGRNASSAAATRRPSLLYDAVAAADIDLATVYEVGLSGKFESEEREEEKKGRT